MNLSWQNNTYPIYSGHIEWAPIKPIFYSSKWQKKKKEFLSGNVHVYFQFVLNKIYDI